MAALTALDAQADLSGVATGGAVNEDLMAKIWDISRIPLPGLDRIGRGTVSSYKYDWVRDRLAAAAANAWVENATYAASASGVTDFANSATAALNRFVNHVQVSVKAVAISEMSQAVSSVGGTGGLAYNLMVAQRELMRDIEYSIFAVNGASVAGNAASTAAKTATYASVIDDTSTVVANATAINAGSGTTFGGWNSSTSVFDAMSSATTAAALAEADIRSLVLNLFQNGACDTEKSLVAMTTATLKQVISAYMYTSTARIGSFVKETGDRAGLAVGNVEYFQTDYALLELVANRFMSTITITNAFTPLWIFDPAQFELVYLRGPTTSALAKQGLVDVRTVSAYWGTRFHPEACGGVVGIDATAAMTAT